MSTHCDACRWAYETTGMSGRPFEQAMVVSPRRQLRDGDTVFSWPPAHARSAAECLGAGPAVDSRSAPHRKGTVVNSLVGSADGPASLISWDDGETDVWPHRDTRDGKAFHCLRLIHAGDHVGTSHVDLSVIATEGVVVEWTEYGGHGMPLIPMRGSVEQFNSRANS